HWPDKIDFGGLGGYWDSEGVAPWESSEKTFRFLVGIGRERLSVCSTRVLPQALSDHRWSGP
ncbi:MAG: hypothetical protein ACREQ7_08235, partial [Candidatus Binatia bacterium]